MGMRMGYTKKAGAAVRRAGPVTVLRPNAEGVMCVVPAEQLERERADEAVTRAENAVLDYNAAARERCQ